jgi:cytochrome c5
LAQGKPTLYKHAIEGYTGKGGVMPAKGGRTDLSDDLVKAAVDYMVTKAQ